MRHLTTLGWWLRLALTVAIAVAALGGKAASAQEDNISAPPLLQFPTLPGPEAKGNFPMSFVRNALESAGNTELCKILTKEVNPNAVFDANFTFAQCDPAIAAKVNSRSGSVRWGRAHAPASAAAIAWAGRRTARPSHWIAPTGALRPSSDG